MLRGIAIGVLLGAVVAGCVDPKDRRPGLHLGGEVVAGPIDDWSFTDEHGEIYIQVATPYLLPHSVTIVCAARDEQLYVGARNPTSKRWVSWVEREPNVRLKIGARVYEQRLQPVDDPAEHEAVFRAYAAKYGWEPAAAAGRPPLLFFRVVERE